MSRVLQFSIFIGIVILVLVGSHLYFYFRLVRAPAWPSPWRQIASWAILLLGLSVPLVFLLGRVLPDGVVRVFTFLPYLWIGIMLLLTFFLVCSDLLKLLGHLGLSIAGHGDFFADAGRRLLRDRIVAGTVAGIVLVLTVISMVNALSAPILKRVQVKLENWPRALDGYKIVQLTDLHLGPTLGGDFLREVVERTNAEKPDLVVITGDLVDAPVDKLLPSLQSLRDLKAPDGVYLVTGNHEFFSGLAEWLKAFETLGIRVLQNERVGITRNGASFDLAGVHDHSGGRMGPEFRPDLEKALAGRDPRRALIVLAHQSLIIDQAERLGAGLVLSGHNHAGQIWPWMYLVGLQQPYVYGLHRRKKTWIYVSAGTGFWGPAMRLGTRSEIVLLTLSGEGS